MQVKNIGSPGRSRLRDRVDSLKPGDFENGRPGGRAYRRDAAE
jgi:hypothetical protein